MAKKSSATREMANTTSGPAAAARRPRGPTQGVVRRSGKASSTRVIEHQMLTTTWNRVRCTEWITFVPQTRLYAAAAGVSKNSGANQLRTISASSNTP